MYVSTPVADRHDKSTEPVTAGPTRHVWMVSVPEAWATDDRIDLATLGLLVRIRATLNAGEPVRVSGSTPEYHQAVAAGYLVGGRLEDPFLPDLPAEGPSVPTSRTSEKAVVYYLRRSSDGCIKIGYTKDLKDRTRRLEAVHGSTELLATEPGGHHLEDARHRRFESLRITGAPRWHGSEWFRPSPDLLGFIAALAGAR